MSEKQPIDTVDPYGGLGHVEGLRQTASLLRAKYASLDVRIAPGGRSFQSHAAGKDAAGILSVTGELVDDSVIAVRLELARASQQARVGVGGLFEALPMLGEKCRLVKPARASESGESSLWVELRVHASPMSVSREIAFVSELEQVEALARGLQADLPASMSSADLVKVYASVSEYVEPVLPLEWAGSEGDPPILGWARETLDFLDGGASVAIAGSHPVVEQFALAALARAGRDCGKTLGQLTLPAVNTRGLVDLARKVPGILAVPALRLSFGSNPYELTNEMQAMLGILSSSRTPVLFMGSFEQLQGAFSGGQGGRNDPLLPVLRRVPDVDLRALARLSIQLCGRKAGGLPASAEVELVNEVMHALEPHSASTRKRILPTVVARTVGAWATGKKRLTTLAYAGTVAALSETLAGLSVKPRAQRSNEVQERYVSVLSSPELLAYLREGLLAQDAALEQLVMRLRMESLTRPSHQPVRYCAQGTPGTGKSESAILIAKRLEIPYVNIDAASMPDYYTAAAQLLGSGRGIVGSFQSGRLEQASKHHRGALIEVSDLDHAVPSVRAALADLFLQILETGEGQSATGAMFSCANVIFAFTMNLPDGMDEAVRRSVGFRNTPSRRDVGRQVSSEIKRVLSGAFLSRVGTPILFDPLDGPALAEIMERAIRSAVLAAAERLHLVAEEVVLENGLGARLVELLESNVASYGARVLLEQGRTLAAEAVSQFVEEGSRAVGGILKVAMGPSGNLIIHRS